MRTLGLMAAGLLLLAAGCAHHELHRDGQGLVLTLRVPGAGDVLFVSSLNGFEPQPARHVGGSTWEVRVRPDSPFSYFYLVDGRVYVPECMFSEPDDFGSRNCVYLPDM
ncbi:MAG TPA: hypothetical protein PLT09_05955 [Deltaproteobacteria bacterium]|nr:hypothetical protein [Deltaproteobacteria bacterium]HXK46963.1 hypothetical protein [Deltaproteobacteria bacterium]